MVPSIDRIPYALYTVVGKIEEFKFTQASIFMYN